MSDARILDRGYRRFEGERAGLRGSVGSLTWHTSRSILGLGRKARYKIVPVFIIVIAFLPVIAFLALTILVGDLLEGELRPDYWEFSQFGLAVFATLLFTAFVTPEAIVRDRRDGMYSLYLSTPLTKVSYLGAKALAVIGTMSLVVLAPSLFLLLGYTFQSLGPDGLLDWLGVMGRLVIAGVGMCVVYSAVSLGVSSLTDRRAFSTIAVIMVMLGAFIATALLVEQAEMNANVLLLDPLRLALEISPRLFGDRSTDYEGVSTWAVALGNLGWTLVGVGTVASRYRKLDAV